ncbi:NADP-dependent malic enzyme [Trichonephila clavata]|uniref:NADP-dependent malic enzyme n=1 Tax=Trichonephila clavata TaxID=2740835 RepID=A0A8X6I8V2_TRICU|nr:NADP-dependent malic enzyme [Trichonephila clavata]
MDIPVFHDDQHGTAVVVAAGIENALDIVGKKLEDVKIIMNGAGAAGIACLEILKSMGAKNIVLCDKQGVIYKGRNEDMNEWKEKYAIDTSERSLLDTIKGADVFIGLSAKDVLNEEMLKSMGKDPIIFALANPDPEVRPEFAKSVRPDAIIATAADAIAKLAREPVPGEISAVYGGRKMGYGREYIIPTPFDPRLISIVAPAVAKAAVDSGVARKAIQDWSKYENQLKSRLSNVLSTLNLLSSHM